MQPERADMNFAVCLPGKPPFDHADTENRAAVKAVRLICRTHGPRCVNVIAPDGQLVGIYERAAPQDIAQGPSQ